MDLTEIGWENVDWILLALDREQYRTNKYISDTPNCV
jgi:hypothetical protein